MQISLHPVGKARAIDNHAFVFMFLRCWLHRADDKMNAKLRLFWAKECGRVGRNQSFGLDRSCVMQPRARRSSNFGRLPRRDAIATSA